MAGRASVLGDVGVMSIEHFCPLLECASYMGLIGDVAKAILILTAVSWVYIIIQFVVMEQYAMALFLLIAFLIPYP
ncbi:MAG: hypothetical protein ACUVTE_03400 [Candidatus Bathycorpusculaceae bacterium]